jgi:hypothetical protein
MQTVSSESTTICKRPKRYRRSATKRQTTDME